MDSPIYSGMVRFAGLHSAQARDFNLTERQLPGGQRGNRISKQEALKQTFHVTEKGRKLFEDWSKFDESLTQETL